MADSRDQSDLETLPMPAAGDEAAHADPPIEPPLTKIIATIGPATSDADSIGKLIDAGVSVFRLNFSHGRLEDHARAVAAIRDVSKQHATSTAIFGDLQGPKIRVGEVPEGGIEVAIGETVAFQRQPITAKAADASSTGGQPQSDDPFRGPPHRFSSTYEHLIDDVAPGQRLLINDGAIRMLIIDKRADEILCTVTHGGRITSGKGINLPDSNISVSSITNRDWSHVRWALEQDLDFLALSFVRTAADVKQLADGLGNIRAEMGLTDFRMPIIAKIELPRAVEDAERIIDTADAIMVARGDLGVEMDLARVPVIQKQLLAIADDYGKPCIIATQMLESMINSPMPTRAEASDVAGAIFDGTDAVMLSGETAVGKYPIVTVETMRRIAHYTEQHLATQPQKTTAPQKLIEARYRTAALAHGVWTVAQDIAAKFVVVWSQEGGGARYLSQNNFHIPIFAASSDARAARRMQLFRSVTPVLMPKPKGLAAFTRQMDQYLIRTGRVEEGDIGIIVAGEPIGEPGVTNSLAIHAVGSPDTGYARHGSRARTRPADR